VFYCTSLLEDLCSRCRNFPAETWFKQSHNEAKLRVVLAPRSADFMDISNILPERVGAAGQKKCILSPSPSSCTSSVQNWTPQWGLIGLENLMTGKAKSFESKTPRPNLLFFHSRTRDQQRTRHPRSTQKYS
jgi:hypothetical protein